MLKGPSILNAQKLEGGWDVVFLAYPVKFCHCAVILYACQLGQPRRVKCVPDVRILNWSMCYVSQLLSLCKYSSKNLRAFMIWSTKMMNLQALVWLDEDFLYGVLGFRLLMCSLDWIWVLSWFIALTLVPIEKHNVFFCFLKLPWNSIGPVQDYKVNSGLG